LGGRQVVNCVESGGGAINDGVEGDLLDWGLRVTGRRLELDTRAAPETVGAAAADFLEAGVAIVTELVMGGAAPRGNSRGHPA
jgi:hypothetical protein